MSPDAYLTPAGDIASFLQPSDAQRFLSIPPPSADALDWLNHSSALYVSGRTDLALIAARHALSLERNPSTLLNLAVILETMGEFYPALPLSAEAHALDPRDPFAMTLYSDDLLRMGRLAEAWPIYSRSHANWDWVGRVIPEWDGTSPLSGKRVLVLSGGGYGDNILFLRWMPRLAALGSHVTFMCPASMHSLLDGTLGIDRLIAGSIAGLEGMLIPSEYDCYTCVLSLGGYFCPRMEDIPTAPYIRNPLLPVRGCIGLCTRAGEEKFPRRHRSLTAVQSYRLRNLIGERCEELNISRGGWDITRDLISTCCLVITVDTGVAHLAGAMNVPCWIILPGFSASYYGVSGDRCSWYPSQRLFRNHGEGIDRAVENVCLALQER